MTAIYPYLTFENAKEAMAYYEQDFSAQITYHEALTKEQAESLGLPVDQLDQTTMRGEFMIAGQKNYLCRCNDGQSSNIYANFNFT